MSGIFANGAASRGMSTDWGCKLTEERVLKAEKSVLLVGGHFCEVGGYVVMMGKQETGPAIEGRRF